MTAPWTAQMLSRRQFMLRSLGVGAGALAAMSTLTRLSALSNPAKPLQVVVVGAGLAGLCAAYELEARGHEVVVLEANAGRLGGRVFTHRFGDGLYGEFGAMRIPAVHQLTRYYVGKFGLSLRPFVQANADAYYYVRGRRFRIRQEGEVNQLYAMTAAEATKSPLDLWLAGVVSVLEGMSAEERADLRRTAFTTTRLRALDQLTLEAALRQAGLSPEAIEFLTVLWGYETSRQTGLTELLREELEEVWIHDFDEIVGGTDHLPYAFAARLKSQPRLGCQVVRIEQDLQARRAAAIYLDRGTPQRVEGDVVLCTVPLGVLSTLDIQPALSGPKARAIRQVTYDSSTKVLALASRRFWESDEGIYGGGTYTDLPTGITYYPADNAGARDPQVSQRQGVLLASYTWGQPARRLGALSHAERSQVVIDNLARVHPQLRQPGVLVRTASWSWDNDPYARGAFCWFAPGQHETLYRHLLEPEGRVLFAGEHTSLTHTWMQGALESALRAVEQILIAA
jgi:monoamine oxidase